MFFRLVPGATVVKGLNTLSAWALQNGLLAGKQVREEVEIRNLLKKDVSGIKAKQPGNFQALRKALVD